MPGSSAERAPAWLGRAISATIPTSRAAAKPMLAELNPEEEREEEGGEPHDGVGALDAPAVRTAPYVEETLDGAAKRRRAVHSGEGIADARA